MPCVSREECWPQDDEMTTPDQPKAGRCAKKTKKLKQKLLSSGDRARNLRPAARCLLVAQDECGGQKAPDRACPGAGTQGLSSRSPPVHLVRGRGLCTTSACRVQIENGAKASWPPVVSMGNNFHASMSSLMEFGADFCWQRATSVKGQRDIEAIRSGAGGIGTTASKRSEQENNNEAGFRQRRRHKQTTTTFMSCKVGKISSNNNNTENNRNAQLFTSFNGNSNDKDKLSRRRPSVAMHTNSHFASWLLMLNCVIFTCCYLLIQLSGATDFHSPAGAALDHHRDRQHRHPNQQQQQPEHVHKAHRRHSMATSFKSNQDDMLIAPAAAAGFEGGLNELGLPPASASEWAIEGRQLEFVPTSLLCATFERHLNSHLSSLSLASNKISKLDSAAFKCLGETLKILFLQDNQISSLTESPFEGLSKLQVLRLSDNLLSVIPPTSVFEPLHALRHLDLSRNQLDFIPADAFPDPILSNLISLNLKANPIERLSPRAFVGLSKLKTLTLAETNLTDSSWPERGFEGLNELRFLYADRMRSGEFRAPSDFCTNSPKLASLVLKSNQLERADQFVSRQCQSLLLLDLSYNRIGPRLSEPSSAPPFRALSNLIDLYLTHNSISHLEEQDFSGLARLQVLELGSNKLLQIHARAFFPLRNSLLQLDVANNAQLTELPPLGLERLETLRCFGNPQLRQLAHFKRARTLILTFAYHCCEYTEPQDAFYDTNKQMIDLRSKSWITDVGKQANVLAPDNNNNNPSSSKSNFIALNDLVVWQQPETITTRPKTEHGDDDNQQAAPAVNGTGNKKRRRHAAHYAMHHDARARLLVECLARQIERIRAYNRKLEHQDEADRNSISGRVDNYRRHYHNWQADYFESWPEDDDDEPVQLLSSDQVGQLVAQELLAAPKRRKRSHQEAASHPFDLDASNTSAKSVRQASPLVDCQPAPSAFFPCRDLFDAWWLRLGIWCVFPLGLLGNFLVIIVLSSVKPSSSTSALTSIMWLAHSKRHIDVPRFLVINLAIADLLMALYLGLLAIVDLSTCGQFRLYAIKWQYSIGCQVAGFLAILSSELSVFILAIITLERNYAITNAVHLNRRLSLQRAMLIMFFGYAFAIAMALLPLQGVNDYRKFSICLPLDLDPTKPSSQIYVITLVGMNTLSFTLLFGCYLRMYCAIRGSQAWNTNDLRIAKRMSILVLTDFLCWSPIIFSALAALLGRHLVDTTGIKIMTIFILPLNSIANPFLYAITTRKFKRDLDNLLYRIRYVISFGRYAKRPPNAHQINHNNNKYNHQLVHHQHHQHCNLLTNNTKMRAKQQQQHIIITCHQNNQQRFRRLKLDPKHHGNKIEMIDNNTDNRVQGAALGGANSRNQRFNNNNTTFNQVTMNQTSCCESNGWPPQQQQQAIGDSLVYNAIDPEHQQQRVEHPRIVFDACQPMDHSGPHHEVANNEQASINDVQSMTSATCEQAPALKTISALSLKSATNFCPSGDLIAAARHQLPRSSLSVACNGHIKEESGVDPLDGAISHRHQRPRSALGNVPIDGNERAQQQASLLQFDQQTTTSSSSTYHQSNNNNLTSFVSTGNCRCAHSNETFHNRAKPSATGGHKQVASSSSKQTTGSLGFGGSGDLASCWSGGKHQQNCTGHQQRPQTPLPGQKSGRKRMRFKPLARAWSSLQISFANSRNQSSLINNPATATEPINGTRGGQLTIRSTSPSSVKASQLNSCCEQEHEHPDETHEIEIEQLQLIEQSSGEHSKLGFEDLIDLELRLDEIFEVTNSPYLLLINPKRLGERRMSRSCETVSQNHHHHSPAHQLLHNQVLQYDGTNIQTHSFDHEHLAQLAASTALQRSSGAYRRDSTNPLTPALSQRDKQKRYSAALQQQSEISTTTTNTSSHLDEDDQRVLLATINQLAARSSKRHRNNRQASKGAPGGQKLQHHDSELQLLGNPSRSTRCRSWSPALLGKLEDCIGQIRQRLPAIASSQQQQQTSRMMTPPLNHEQHLDANHNTKEALITQPTNINIISTTDNNSSSSSEHELIDLGELDDDEQSSLARELAPPMERFIGGVRAGQLIDFERSETDNNCEQEEQDEVINTQQKPMD